MNLLLSAVETPKAAMFGKDLYPSIYDKAAAYLFHIVQNHPFNDANKRTGFGAAYLFLRANRVPILLSDEAFEESIRVSQVYVLLPKCASAILQTATAIG